MTTPALGFAFAAPGWLWLAPLVMALLVWRARRAPCAVLATAGTGLALPRTWRSTLASLPAWLEAAGLGLLVVALAGPIERVPAPPVPPGRDLVLCLDTSSSMAANDLAPDATRLDVGKRIAAEFVRARRDDRVALVTFARYVDVRCPLTADRDAVRELLDALALVPKEGPEDATAIGAAVGSAALLLRRAGRASRVVVLVTDGEENVASPLAPDEIAPLHAAQLCREAGIRVHTIVVGRGNPRADGRVQALDPTAVQQLAATTNGRYFTAGDAAALASVYAAIDALETSPAAATGVVVRELFVLATLLAVAALAVARALAGTVLRRLP